MLFYLVLLAFVSICCTSPVKAKTIASSSIHTASMKQEKQSPELLGYWENWNDVSWWDNNIPGNCAMGCAKAGPLMDFMKDYSSINYGFTFLTENPNPDQINCSTKSNCPVWDGRGIYIAQSTKQGATVVNDATTVSSIDQSPGLIGISETCRLVRQGPYTTPRRCKISLGGWSDWARIGSVQNAAHIGKLVANMVLLSFADGIDLDFEHLAEYSTQYTDTDEMANYVALVKSIRENFDAISNDLWVKTAQTRMNDLTTTYNTMPDWQKNQAFYFPTNIKYMQDIMKNGKPYLEISLTTRFNGFINASDPFNYLDKKSPVPVPFLTDNEVAKMWKSVSSLFDTVNIMAYDAGSGAGPLVLNFRQIIDNFINLAPMPGSQINIGFEPGDQSGGGVWEGMDTDVDAAKYMAAQKGGSFIWSINPTTTNSAHWAPILAEALYKEINPTYPYTPVPVYTKCDPTTGWIKA